MHYVIPVLTMRVDVNYLELLRVKMHDVLRLFGLLMTALLKTAGSLS